MLSYTAEFRNSWTNFATRATTIMVIITNTFRDYYLTT